MQLAIPVSDLLPLIPLAARAVVHVGCGRGELAAAYRQLNPKAHLLGIEPDALAASRAAAHMHQVSVTEGEADPLPFDLSFSIDCIVYNDISQHLQDPWAMIRRHSEVLSPDGVMLICVPNVEYWRLTDRRLRGGCEDEETGWQHHRHAASFSMAGIRQQVRRAGLTLCDITPWEPDKDSARWFSDALTSGLSALGINAADYAGRAAACQWICRARKEPVREMILSGNMLTPVGGVSHVRVVHPLQAVGSDPAITTAVTDRVDTRRPTDGVPRIFVLHRPILTGEQGLNTLRKLSASGYLIVTEFDDHPDHFPMMRQGGDLSFLGAHALQTSTGAMAEILRKYNPEIAVFPNAVVSLPEVRNFTDPQRLTLFFGALNREKDWLPLMPIINAVAAEAGEHLRFEVVHDQAFFDALATKHKTFTPTCDYDTYLELLGGSELSFMPLSDTEFNRAKSDLKFIEAGACRTAALASSVVYGNSIEDGRTGLLFRDPTQFQCQLLRLIATPGLARDLGDAARRYVTDHRMLAYQVAPRIAWYRSLWTRRDGLEAARQARVQGRMTRTTG
jgi:glycosyltransferase involved in cell wall biosynthesis